LPISVIGTNTPLIKIRGNLIRVAKSITSEGLSVTGAEIKIPKVEKQKAAIMVPRTKEKLIISPPNKITPAKIIKEVTKRPNRTEATISPKMMAQREIGEDTNLSRVFILVSQGAITGVIAETAEKRAIPSKPEIIKSKDTFLLKKKEIKRKAGISNPWIITGPLR
jgi:hypothetical protein